ncbi:Hypothetical protein CINCED_3A025195 [Cinara cedri]|uniref:Nucleolar protein 4 helical domain-containing protein n=1 Tax=Cinara cedri TaxID=506608 RepID=A0A5E4M955_9HEMI|nr:Hypothetical protein CINCED_3A025195 [Cinara cedri]
MAEQYKEQHRRWYAEWIRRQYSGPGCRAKIVGRTKYEQIVRAVRGELRRAAENSKFRFWVRAKGFRMGRPAAAQVDDSNALYVLDPRNRSSAAVTGGGSRQQNCPMYKKVAVVDEFFDIIYRVHCSGGGISARHSGQKRTHRMIMETYAFLPREAVTAFLMGCPQCTTNTASPSATTDNMLADNTQQVPQPPLQPISTSGFYCGVSVEKWSASFACSTPVKSDGENYCTSTTDSAVESNRIAKIAVAVVTMGADKENVMDNNDVDAVSAVSAADNRNKRKRTVPLKRDAQHRSLCRVVATDASVVLGDSSTGSSTLRNSSSSGTLIWSSSSSTCGRTDNSAGASKSSSGGWWSKWGVRNRGSARFSTSSDLSGSAGQPLDLSSSPLLAISPAPPKVRFDDFFYKRRRVRRRRKPKRLNRPDFGGGRRAGDRYDGFGDDDDTSDSVSDANGPDAEELNAGHSMVADGGGDAGDEDDGPRPAKVKRMMWPANAAVGTTKTRDEDSAGSDGTTTAGLDDRPDGNREKSAAMHLPINKRMNGGSHPYHTMHHNARSILNGLATSSSPSTLSKSLDTITSSSGSHHNFHRHWLDMANESVTNSNLMDVDGSAEDSSMAAAAALLFSPPSSVGGGISPGGPLSSLNPNSHLAHHHALSPLAPPPHSANSVGLAPAHHHHHQHIQQQLQQYAAAAVAAATAAAAAAAAASSAGDSTSPPPNLPLTLPPMAHHYNQNNNITGPNKRRSGGTGLTVQQQLYRRAGTPTSSTTSSPSPRLLNSKNDADTTTSGLGLHENGNFSTSGLPTTTTTVLWPPLGLLTAAHHHNMSSPPKFQELFGSTVNTLAAVTSGSQVLPALPPPPISSPSSSYRHTSKDTNGMQTSNANVSGTDIGIGTSTGNTANADEEDPAIDDDDDEEDEEDEEEEEEDLDDDEMEEGEEYGDEEEEGERAMSGGDSGGAQNRRLRRQQVRRLRQFHGAGDRNATNSQNDGTESGLTSNYHQNWQQPSNSTTSAMSISKQQHQQSIGSSSQQHIDPERLKAFNMFVRLFVDENLDRQVPISRQPKDKVQAIIDSCGRQFPELSDRSRKRIRTYLKSCRRNKRNTPQSGGAASSSPPPAANPWPSNGSTSDPNGQPVRVVIVLCSLYTSTALLLTQRSRRLFCFFFFPCIAKTDPGTLDQRPGRDHTGGGLSTRVGQRPPDAPRPGARRPAVSVRDDPDVRGQRVPAAARFAVAAEPKRQRRRDNANVVDVVGRRRRRGRQQFRQVFVQRRGRGRRGTPQRQRRAGQPGRRPRPARGQRFSGGRRRGRRQQRRRCRGAERGNRDVRSDRHVFVSQQQRNRRTHRLER